jgi:hypothetical protein
VPSVEARAVEAELSNATQVDALIDGVLRDLGGVDILYNNAAIMSPWRDAHTTPVDDYRNSFEVNVIALTRLFSSRLPAPPPPGEANLWPGMSLTHVGAMVRVHLQLASPTPWSCTTASRRAGAEQLQRLRPARLGGFPPVVMLTRDPSSHRTTGRSSNP